MLMMKFAQISRKEMQARCCATIAALLFVITTSSYAAAQLHESESVVSPNPEEQEALDIVSQRIAGYNSHDIEAFLAAHAEQVQIFEFPERKIGVGRAHLKSIFAPQFELGKGHVEVLGQFAIGNRVVSHEHITVDGIVERLVTVYTVEKGVITSFRLIESSN
jgi:hypothetical protein